MDYSNNSLDLTKVENSKNELIVEKWYILRNLN